MARKTIDVATVVEWANTRLAIPDSTHRLEVENTEQAFRLGVSSLLEQILHNTDNYNGFQYVDVDGKLVYPFKRGETDETRKRYYPPKSR
jgi:hypothetical protein